MDPETEPESVAGAKAEHLLGLQQEREPRAEHVGTEESPCGFADIPWADGEVDKVPERG